MSNGYGVYIQYNGSRYEGEWLDDKQHGEGIERFPEEAMFKGQYKNGLKHGKGKFIWKD